MNEHNVIVKNVRLFEGVLIFVQYANYVVGLNKHNRDPPPSIGLPSPQTLHPKH
jgi:hypothetical protein